jgi:hypothetical protein
MGLPTWLRSLMCVCVCICVHVCVGSHLCASGCIHVCSLCKCLCVSVCVCSVHVHIMANPEIQKIWVLVPHTGISLSYSVVSG